MAATFEICGSRRREGAATVIAAKTGRLYGFRAGRRIRSVPCSMKTMLSVRTSWNGVVKEEQPWTDKLSL